MAGQTTMNGAGTNRLGPAEGLMEGIESFGNDVANLLVLQGRLALTDLRESLQKATPALILLSAAVGVILACLVVGLLGLSYRLAAAWNVNPYNLMMILAVIGFVLCAGAGFFAVRQLMRSFTNFRRSQDELRRNLAWIRTVLVQSGR